MPTKKQLNAKRVREWRKRQREDPEKHANYKRKEKERNEKRRQNGKLPAISDLSKRDQRAQRKYWKVKQRSKREKDRQRQNDMENMITPPNSPDVQQVPYAPTDRQTKGRKRVRKDRAKAYREVFSLKIKLQDEKRQKEKYKKRCQRLRGKKLGNRNITEKVNEIVKQNKTKKALFVHQAIISRIRNRYKMSKTHKERQMISSLICSYKMMRKLRLLTYVREITGIGKGYCVNKMQSRKVARRPLIVKDNVVSYLERDDNTRLKAGKKSTLTKYGEKKQIRLLNDTMVNLHKKFLTEQPGKLSYSLFCTLKPFYIRAPNAADRDTCQCKTHENLQFKLEKCKYHGLLPSENIDDAMQQVTCNTESKQCMYRECDSCKNKKLDVTFPVNEGTQTWWYNWKTKQQEKTKIINGQTSKKYVSVTIKDKAEGTLRILSEELQKDIQRATRHIFNIRHQYKALKLLKDGLSHEEIMMHIDFSENYNCKYAKEIQSMHFGASQRQISLHTGVAYSATTTYSFCTMSDCLKHSPSAIWAHLHPVIEKLVNETGATKVHFISDGPTTQYRNKQNLFFLSNKIYDYGFTEASWNFLEASHGKGAADGIGSVIKRTADRLVNVNQKDIMKASDLMDILQGQTNVSLHLISEESVNTLEASIPQNLKPIPNTMQLHQVTTASRGTLRHRVLSCFCTGLHCNCFEPKTTNFIPEISQEHEHTTRDITVAGQANNSVEAVADQANNSVEAVADQANNSVEAVAEPANNSVEAVATNQQPTTNDVEFGLVKIDVVDESLKSKYCVVVYDGLPYPGIIQDVDDDEECEVRVMHKIGTNRYFWPMMDDIIWYSKNDIITLLKEPPKPVTKRHYAIDPTVWCLIEIELDL